MSDTIDKITFDLVMEVARADKKTKGLFGVDDTTFKALFRKAQAEAKAALLDYIESEIIGEDVELRDKADHLPNFYHYAKGKNDLRAEQRNKLKTLRGK